MSIHELQEVVLDVTPATREAFAPYGHIVAANVSGQVEPGEAALDLMAGRPRLYIMRLEARARSFASIARHCRVTQCLASVGGRPWLLAVAPAADLDDLDAAPAADSIVAFEIPGDVFVLLHKGTWHAGPYFDGDRLDFFNLELDDTNERDFHEVDLRARCARTFRFAG
jgi:ureidoglycolate lyase